MRDAIAPGLAHAIRLVVLDVDGVQTDGGLYIGADEHGHRVELKRFDITDGLGVGLMKRAGMTVVMLSGRASPANRQRAEDLGVASYEGPGGRKLEVMNTILSEYNVDWNAVACVCDDLADVPLMRRAALPVAVANAVPEVRAEAQFTMRRSGGSGAVREFAEALLHARGEWTTRVEEYVRERGG